jgi:multiple antibiotic resistance protein
VVLGLLGAVMVLNLLAMLLVRTLMRGIVPIALQILGAVLGVLQVALALNIIISALVRMGIPMTPG